MIRSGEPSLFSMHSLDYLDEKTPEHSTARPSGAGEISNDYWDTLELRPSNESTMTTLLEHSRNSLPHEPSLPPPDDLTIIDSFRHGYATLVKIYAPEIPYANTNPISVPVVSQSFDLRNWLHNLAEQSQPIRDTVLSRVSQDLTGLRQPTRLEFSQSMVALAERSSVPAQAKIGENLVDCLPFATTDEAKALYTSLLALVRNMNAQGDQDHLRATIVQKLAAYVPVLPYTEKHENLIHLGVEASNLPANKAVDAFETCCDEAVNGCFTGTESTEILDVLNAGVSLQYHTAQCDQPTRDRLKKLSDEIKNKLRFYRCLLPPGRSDSAAAK